MIDLSKLAAFQLPSVEENVFILGEMQKLKIYAMKQTTSLRFTDLDESKVTDRIKAVVYVVADALLISEEDAQKLCDVDFAAASKVSEICNRITREFNNKQELERNTAEKNLQAGLENMPAK